jgi:uncharacterized protein (DUF488 family)
VIEKTDRESTRRAIIYTVGHSTRTISEFVRLLQSAGVDTVVDVRSLPRSRRNPDYNLDRLPGLLANHQIGHEHIAELGGRRGKSHDVAPKLNAFWENQSFHNYADHALSEHFSAGLNRLVGLAGDRRCAIMCSEAVWWRCHRRIIADHLIARGYEVLHLMAPNLVTRAELTRGAVLDGNRVTYPRVEQQPVNVGKSIA